jgi:acyl-CoA oxidase
MSANDETKPHYQISDTKNVHLLTERESATFNVEELTQFLFGGPGNYFEINKRRQISSVSYHLFFLLITFFLCLVRLALAHPIHRTHLPFEYLSVDEHYSLTIRKSLLAIREAERLKIMNSKHRFWFFDIFVNNHFAFFIHTIMCVHALENMATEEQKQQFLPLAQSFRIITAYVQTELGHGTDIRRLETEAVFDRTTDSFILNTPTLSSTKFWPGALARTVNYVLLMAQLYTPDRDHPCGLQMFLVQIRDLNTHEPLPGWSF